GLLDDAEKDAGLAVVAGDRAVVFHAGFSASDVAQADDLRAFVLDDELIVLFGRLEFAAGLDGHLAVEVLNAAAGQLDILLVLRAQVNGAREIELDGDAADLLAALAGEGLYSFDIVDLLFEPLGDFGFDHLRVGARKDRGDGNNGRINVRQLAHRQA